MISLTVVGNGSSNWTNTLLIPKVFGYDKHYVVTIYHGAQYIYAIDSWMTDTTGTTLSFAKSTSTDAWNSVEKDVKVIGLITS